MHKSGRTTEADHKHCVWLNKGHFTHEKRLPPTGLQGQTHDAKIREFEADLSLASGLVELMKSREDCMDFWGHSCPKQCNLDTKSLEAQQMLFCDFSLIQGSCTCHSVNQNNSELQPAKLFFFCLFNEFCWSAKMTSLSRKWRELEKSNLSSSKLEKVFKEERNIFFQRHSKMGLQMTDKMLIPVICHKQHVIRRLWVRTANNLGATDRQEIYRTLCKTQHF